MSAGFGAFEIARSGMHVNERGLFVKHKRSNVRHLATLGSSLYCHRTIYRCKWWQISNWTWCKCAGNKTNKTYVFG